jgi:type IV pilus assembly protein PilB
MKAEPFLLASSVTAIVGQRVVRKVCQSCKEVYLPEPAVVEDMKTVLGGLFEAWKQGRPEAVEMAKKMGGEVVLTRGKGCVECGNSGYRGRIGVFEVLAVDEKIARLIMERSDAGTLEKTAVNGGMILMKQDGYIKVLEAITTIEEVLRVAQI